MKSTPGIVISMLVFFVAGSAPLGAIEELVVTAQKREQNIQDVSISVSAFSGDRVELLGFEQPIDIATQIPNFHVKNEVGKATPTFTIRGVGLGAFSHNSVSPVAVYVDEVFMPSTTQLSFSLFDLERVEVLKGPQGDLFGRNTTAGSVSFVSRKPAQEFEGRANIGLGSYETVVVDAAIGGGISDTVSVRLAGKWDYQAKGFFDNALSGKDIGKTNTFSSRAAVRWEPTQDFELNFNVHAGRDRSENHPWVAIGTSDPALPAADPAFPGGQRFSTDCASTLTTPIAFFQQNCVTKNGYRDTDTDPFKGEWGLNSLLETDVIGFVNRMDWAIGAVTLTSVTGYENMEKITQEDFDGSPFALGDNSYGTDLEVFTQELRVSSNEPAFGLMDYVAGVVYYQDQQEQEDLFGYLDRTNHDVLLNYDQETTSWAAFIHTETGITDQFKLIAGIRYTDDETDFRGATSIVNTDDDGHGPRPIFVGPGLAFDFAGLYPGNLVAFVDDAVSAQEATGKVGLDWTPNDDWLVYVNFSRGYKAGGFVGFWATLDEEYGPYKPEFVNALEGGFKASLSDNSLQVSAAVFTYDYKDVQLFGFTPNFAFTILNAGTGDMTGMEVDVTWRPVAGLDLRAAYGYLDAEIDVLDQVSGVTSRITAPNAPENSFSGFARYETPLPNGMIGSVQTDFSWTDDTFFDVVNRLAVSQGAYWLANARVGIETQRAGGNWSASFWVKNLADKEYFGQVFQSGTANAVSATAGNPRTWGFELGYRF